MEHFLIIKQAFGGDLMISKKYKGTELKGKKAKVDCDIRNGGGQGISAGSIVTIVNVVRGKGLTIKTEKCPHCGQYAYITGVSREILTLLES